MIDNNEVLSFSYDDISFYQRKALFDKEYFFFGSKNEDSFIRVNRDNYEFVLFAYEKIKQGITIDELKEEYSKKYKTTKIDVEGLIQIFKGSGFIKGYEKTYFDNEIDLLGFTVFKKEIKAKKEKKKSFIYKLFSFYIIIPILLAFTLFTGIYFGSYNYKTNYFLYENDLIGVIVIWLSSFVAIALHELGHYIVARNENIELKNFNLGFLLGLIPMFYFKYKNIKIAQYKSKLKLLFAGVYTNFLLFLLFLGITFLPINNIIKDISIIFSITNLVYGLSNLIPTRFGDGYFIITTILGEISPRINFYNSLRRKEKKKTNKGYLVYIIISYSLVIISSVLFIYRAITNINNGRYIFGYFSLMLYIITFVFFIINTFLDKNLFHFKKPYLINNENKIKKVKRKNNLLLIISFLFSIAIMSLTNSYTNTKDNNINNYVSNNGISDVIILNREINNTNLNNKINEYKKTITKIDSSLLSFTLNNNTYETNVIYCDINEVNLYYGLKIENNKNQVIVNDYFINKFNTSINNEIVVENNKYVISKTSDKLNYVFNNSPLMLIDYQNINLDNKNLYGEIIFLDLNHDNNLVKNITSYLDDNNYSYIDMYSDYNYVVNQTETLKTFIIFIIIFLSLIGLMLLYYLIYTNLKTSNYYWSCLHNIGLSNKEIIKTLTLKITKLLSFGSLFGLLIGTLFTYIYTMIRNETHYLSSIPNILYLILPLIICLVGFIFNLISYISLNKKKDNINVKEKKNKIVVQNIVTFTYLFLGTIFLLFALLVFKNDYLISLVLYIICTILFFIFIYQIIFKNIIPKIKYKNINLISYSSKLFSKPTLILSSIILFSFLFISSGFYLISSAESWAYNKAKNEYYYSYRLETKNDDLGSAEINNIINLDKSEIINVYYGTSGKVRSTSYNFFASNGSSKIEKSYDLDVNLNLLKENEIVLNTYGIGDSKLKLGDKINVTLLGEKKELIIVGFINSLDHYGRTAFISPSYYQKEYFSSIILEGNYSGDEESFKKLFSNNIINYLSKDELISNQVENIISGMDTIESVFITITALLFLILYFSINESLSDKKRLFAIIRTFGLNKKNTTLLLILEWILLSIILTLIFSIFSPVISSLFINFATFSSLGEAVTFTFNPLIYFLLSSLIFFLPLIVSIKSSINVSSVDMIYEVKNII